MDNSKKNLSQIKPEILTVVKKRKHAPRRKVTKRMKIRSLKIVKKLSGVTRNRNKMV